jgi:hypothetical protein
LTTNSGASFEDPQPASASAPSMASAIASQRPQTPERIGDVWL